MIVGGVSAFRVASSKAAAPTRATWIGLPETDGDEDEGGNEGKDEGGNAGEGGADTGIEAVEERDGETGEDETEGS